MGKVAALMKVFPEDMDKFESIKQAIQEQVKPASIVEEPVAFGFKALKVTIVRDDKEGVGNVEEVVRAIPGVSQAEITDVGLIS
ncbi:MAG: elongation factor 1-beta [Candidatus Micrarchaeota archaeon]